MNRRAARSSASVRLRVATGTLLVSLVGMAVLVGAVLLVAGGQTDREMRQVLDTRLIAVRETTEAAAGEAPADTDDPLADTLSWVAAPGGRIIAGPEIPRGLRAAVQELARSGHGTRDVGTYRLLAASLAPGHQRGRVVVALDTHPYRTGLMRLAVAGAVLGIAVVLGVTLLARRIVTRALAPVAAMTATADEWSQERPDARFALGAPRDEITGLAAVLDGLLERVDGALRAEQRLTAELAHELRTPLTVIRGEAELGASARRLRAADRARYERITAAADDMGRAMTTLLDAARAQTGPAVCDVAAVLAAQAERPGLTLPVVVGDTPPGLVAAVPADLLGRAIGPLVDNAARHGRTSVRVSAERQGERIAVRVEDDGPGVAALAGDPFDPGVRDAASPGAGLGLSLVRRLARSAGGDAVLVSRKPAVFAVVVPVA